MMVSHTTITSVVVDGDTHLTVSKWVLHEMYGRLKKKRKKK
jgi:hypothetical protein